MPHVFRFLRRLPEEEVRTDRRPENGNDHLRLVRPQRGTGREAARQFQPTDADDKKGRYIGEENKGEPFEDGNIARVLEEELHRHACRPEEDDEKRWTATGEKPDDLPHRAEIRSNVDDIGG